MAPFYTGLGDSGDTGYLGAGRISKASLRIEAIGSVDEATAFLGLARSLTSSDGFTDVLLTIQKHLYQLMSELAASPENAGLFDSVHPDQVTWLEEKVNEIEGSTEMPAGFHHPRGIDRQRSPFSGAHGRPPGRATCCGSAGGR